MEKVKLLMKQGHMRAAGFAAFAARKDQTGYSVAKRKGSLTREFEARLKSNHKAWAYFDGAAPSCKRDAVWWVMSAKKEETRARRLDVLIASSEEGLRVPVFRKKNTWPEKRSSAQSRSKREGQKREGHENEE